MLENDETQISLLMQDIVNLINEKSEQVDYSKKSEQAIMLQIIICLDELNAFQNTRILINALYRLRALDYKWIRFKNENKFYGESLLNFIDIIVFSKEKLRFEIPYFFLSELKKVNFNLEHYLHKNQL